MKLMRWMSAGRLWVPLVLLCCVQGQAGQTEDSLVSIKSRLPFISTGEFLFRRQPRDYTLKKEVTAAWNTLTELHSTQLVTKDLLQLVSHADADLRALALLALVAKETPEVVPVCLELVGDSEFTLPREDRSFIVGGSETGIPAATKPQTVGDIARAVLYMLNWPGDMANLDSWWAPRKGNPGWLAWHQFLYNRATQGTRPVADSDVPHVRRFMDSLAALPSRMRAWVMLYLADDVFMSRGQWEDEFATEAEMVAAAKGLGSEALLEFLRSGRRQGLREPALDKPENGRRFIITYASRLFGAEHADVLLALKLYTAAADADPTQVRRVADVGMKDLDKPHQSWDRARVMAALAALGDATDRERATKWFYTEPNPDSGSSPQSIFIGDLKLRKPAEWQEIARRLVVDPAFERLKSLDVMYLGIMVDTLEGEPAVPTRDDAEYHRKRLRAKFQIE